jgi:HEAT repeat protein
MIGGKAVSEWIKALEDPDSKVRLKAIYSLGSLRGPPAKPAVAALTKALKDPNNDVRRGAAVNLGFIGPGATDAVGALLAALEDTDDGVRYAVGAALGQIGGAEAAPALIKVLKDPKHRGRTAASTALTYLAAKADPVPLLADLLGDREASTRALAALTLARLGTRSRPAVPSLIAALKDEGDDARLYAAYALAQIGPGAKMAVPQLIITVGNSGGDLRLMALQALSAVGPDAAAATPKLIEALKDDNEDVRLSALEALARIGPGAKEAVGAVVAVFQAGDIPQKAFPRVNPFQNPLPLREGAPRRFPPGIGSRRMAIEALIRIGADAPPAVSALVSMLRSKDRVERRIAASALAVVGRSAVPELLKILQGDALEPRLLVIETLGAIGGANKEVVTALAQALADRDGEVSQQAALALGLLGPAAVEAVPELRKTLMGNRDGDVRAAAAHALGDVGAAACPAIPDLLRSLKDSDELVRQWSAYALGEIGPQAKDGVSELTNLLRDNDAHVRRSAARALARIRGETQ